MSETVCIPKARYEHLVRCEKIIESEFNEDFSEDFIRDVKESEDAYKKGAFIEVKGAKDRKNIFDSL